MKIMTLHVVWGTEVLEKYTGHEQAQRAAEYVLSQDNLQVLWEGVVTICFRRVLTLSNTGIKPSVLLSLGITEGLMGSFHLQS